MADTEGVKDSTEGVITSFPHPEVEIEKHHSVDEVSQRLFAVPDLSKAKESTWGFFSSVAENIKHGVDEIKSGGAIDGVVKNLKTVDKNLSQKFESFNILQKPRSEANTSFENLKLPWEDEENHADDIKSKILDLTSSDDTFLVPPPSGEEFLFSLCDEKNMQEYKNFMVSEVPAIAEKLSSLVPSSLSEAEFWTNFFYKVQLVKSSYNIGVETKPAEIFEEREEKGSELTAVSPSRQSLDLAGDQNTTIPQSDDDETDELERMLEQPLDYDE